MIGDSLDRRLVPPGVTVPASWRLLYHRKRKEHLTAKKPGPGSARYSTRSPQIHVCGKLLTVGYYLLPGAALASPSATLALAIMAFVSWCAQWQHGVVAEMQTDAAAIEKLAMRPSATQRPRRSTVGRAGFTTDLMVASGLPALFWPNRRRAYAQGNGRMC
jgi:hypothetical protein